eukprot:scaffold445691_cov13-Prasinocladus_malaysianus.AAC.1
MQVARRRIDPDSWPGISGYCHFFLVDSQTRLMKARTLCTIHYTSPVQNVRQSHVTTDNLSD